MSLKQKVWNMPNKPVEHKHLPHTLNSFEFSLEVLLKFTVGLDKLIG